MTIRFLLPAAIFAAASPAESQEPERKDTVALERVTVTATRSSQTAFKVPLAVTTVGGDEAKGSTGIGLDQALKYVPGVLAQSRAGGTDVRIVIRGYGARGAGDRSNAGTSRGIRILLDGFPETEPDGRTAFDAIDLSLADRLDVIRSNASALWGNASGGLVNVSTVPTFRTSRIAVEPMTGSFGLQRMAASVGGGFGAGGRAWVDHTNTAQDGWRANSSGRRQLLNAGLTTPLGARTDLTVHATATNNLVHMPGPLTWAEFEANPQQANATYLSRRERRHNRTGRLGVSIDHESSDETGFDVSVYVNPKYLQRSERGTYRDFTRYHFGSSAVGHTTHAFGSRRAVFSGGADAAYQSGAILFYNLTPAGERGTTLRDNKSEGARNVGVFVQEELPLTSRLTATLGARYDEIFYDYKSFIDPTLNDERAFDGVSPKIGVSYSLGPAHVLYANVGGGVEAPAGNETDPSPIQTPPVTSLNPLLDPIRSTTFEIGTRRAAIAFAGVEWSYDAALYNTEVKNEIVPYAGGRYYFTAGKARRQGFELGVAAQTEKGLGAQTAITLNRHRYSRYVVDSVYYGRAGFSADYSGNKVVGVPDRMVSGEVFYQPTQLPSVRFELGARFTGDYFADDANAVRIPSSSTLDGGIAVVKEVGGTVVRGRIAVDNITDRRFVASAFLNPDRNAAGEPMAFEPGLPRTVVFSLSLSRSR